MAPGGPAEKKGNVLPLWGNEKTMNLNNLILTNILSSPYFKVNLYKLKTYHEVVDEIYYNVQHLEPWEKGSRKTSGQTGMCGGVRGVGAGGIVSTAFCILYKLFTLKLTRKQLNGLMNHCDSPYIRALGFMYIRFTQPPADLVDWYEPYLDDEEELDVKAGGGQTLRMGDMLRHFLTKLEWFATLFPRIPVPIQKEIERRLALHPPMAPAGAQAAPQGDEGEPEAPADELAGPEARRRRSPYAREFNGGRDGPGDAIRDRERPRERRSRSRDRYRDSRHRSRSREARPHRSGGERPRDSDRPRDADRTRDPERPRDADRLREADRLRDSDRARDTERSRESDRSRDHERSRDTERSRESERARDSDRSRESDRHRHRGSPERRHVERPRDRSRERLREQSRDQRSLSRRERSRSPIKRDHHR